MSFEDKAQPWESESERERENVPTYQPRTSTNVLKREHKEWYRRKTKPKAEIYSYLLQSTLDLCHSNCKMWHSGAHNNFLLLQPYHSNPYSFSLFHQHRIVTNQSKRKLLHENWRSIIKMNVYIQMYATHANEGQLTARLWLQELWNSFSKCICTYSLFINSSMHATIQYSAELAILTDAPIHFLFFVSSWLLSHHP